MGLIASLILVLVGFAAEGGSLGAKRPSVPKAIREQILAERSSTTPAGDVKPYVITKTKSNVSFFLTPPGPCSCDVQTSFECVTDLKQELQSAIKRQAEWAKVECSPNAGCVLGGSVSSVQCP